MNDPVIIRILAQKITLRETDPGSWLSNGMGRCNQAKGEILLRADMAEDVKMQTLHEILHMIADMNGLKMNEDETAISVLACGLMTVLRDNPEITKRLAALP